MKAALRANARLFFVLCLFGVNRGSDLAHTPTRSSATCSQMREGWTAVNASLQGLADLEARRKILSFLATLSDDPENCATRSAQERLVDVESRLMQLNAGSLAIAPNWLYQCASIDGRTQKCTGGTPFEDAIPRDTNEIIRGGHVLSEREPVASVKVDPGTGCRVESVSISEFQWFFTKRRQPRILSRSGGRFRTTQLRSMKTPVLLAAIRCDGALPWRKAAWLPHFGAP